MKLRNKNTRETLIFDGIILPEPDQKRYNSLAELNEDWEDVEEPKEDYIRVIDSFINYIEEAVDSFVCDESVEEFAEKLEAFKQLKAKGFRFNRWTIPEKPKTGHIKLTIEAEMDAPDSPYDLDLLFRRKTNED